MTATQSALATQPPASTAGLSRWLPVLPTISLNTLNPFAAEASSTAEKQPSASDPSSVKRRSMFSSFLGSPQPDEPSSPAKSTDGNSIMFAEPDTRSTSDADSREGSIADDSRTRSKRNNSKNPKTRFSMCHAPPNSGARQRLHRRPRSLLQLHRISPGARPVPAFEVVPSANFSVTLTRAITKVFKAKHGLCPNDLVVLRAEKYSADDVEEEQAAQDVIGLICKGRREDPSTSAGKAKICVASGEEWDAYPLANGGYEMSTTDEHGLGKKVRWVPKKGAKTKSFKFSTISQNSRRHPVLATLGRTGLDVNDVYKMPIVSTPLSTPRQGPTLLADAMDEEDEAADVVSEDRQEQCVTEDSMRELIVLTGAWVTFKESWSPTFRYHDDTSTTPVTASALRRITSAQNSPSKATTASPIFTPPGSPKQPPPLHKTNSIVSVGSSIFRRTSLLSKSNRASQISVPPEELLLDERAAPARADSVKKATGRARGDSTSTVLVHRAASNRRKNNQATATWRPDFIAAGDELTETSREDGNGTPPRSQQASLQPAPQIADPFTTSTSAIAVPQRIEPIARLPSPLLSSSAAERVPSPPPTPTPERAAARTMAGRLSRSESEGKRVSNATTEETQGSLKASKSAAAKKKGGWRRILCGNGDI